MAEGKGTGSSSRWNPTKEQIGLLEGLYKQGLRTPSAEQIQQITAKLREFGSIEGKNVFYWFQNHKARQRQRQKQDTFAYFTRLLHHAPPPPTILAPPPLTPPLPPSAPCTNVVGSPYYLHVAQVGNAGLYQQQYTNIFVPGTLKRRTTSELQRSGGAVGPEACINSSSSPQEYHHAQQTLELFPLHPTGILEDKSGGSSLTTASGESESLEEGEEGSGFN